MNRAQSTSVLLAVTPAPLLRVVEHLLGYDANLQVVARVDTAEALLRTAVRTLPDIAIVSERLIGPNPREAVLRLRQLCYGTKVLVIRVGWEDFAAPRDYAADAYVREPALVRRLKAMLARLSEQERALTVH